MLYDGKSFGMPETVTGVTMRACEPIPGSPEIEIGARGPVYEVRTYVMAHDSMEEGFKSWADAIPGRSAVSKPLVLMATTDGPATGLIHIWPYKSVDERSRIRGEVIAKGVWPPKNGPLPSSCQAGSFSWLQGMSSFCHPATASGPAPA